MAVRRSRAASGFVLSVVLLGVARAQGSGSHDHTGQPHAPASAVEVLGAIEVRELPLTSVPTVATATTTTVTVRLDVPSVDAVGVADAGAVGAAELTDPPATGATGIDRALVDDALARISYPWADRLHGWVVAFEPARDGLRGLTLPDTRRVEIYVRATDTPDSLARVLAHELGHAVDVTRNDARDRQAWRAARGVAPSVPWWPNDAAADFDTLAGDFAEAFAVWQTGAVSESTVAGPPTADQLALLASLAA